MTRWARGTGKLALRLGLVMMAGWAAAAIYYSSLPGFLRPWVAGLFGAGSLYLIVVKYRDRRAGLLFLAAFTAVLIGWLLIPPSNHRQWQPDVALLPWAEIRGDSVAFHNIRNCDYRSETEYTVRHYDRTFDLSKLRGADLSLTYWGSPLIAHTMLSFDFGDEGIVCFSVETRKEVGEKYSTVKGFFRQYELTYVVADERDLIRLRTNYRGETVYLYRLTAPAKLARTVFLDYVRQMNSLKERPQWYNALTSNCTTNIQNHVAPFNPDARFDWRIIVNGFIDEMLYERKSIDTSMPLAELKKRSLVNERAKKADKSPAFSQLIRIGLPERGGNLP